jgi:hypothetical protein
VPTYRLIVGREPRIDDVTHIPDSSAANGQCLCPYANMKLNLNIDPSESAVTLLLVCKR